MQIDIRTLTKPLAIDISGTETWLNNLYASFPAPPTTEPPKLTGQAQVRQDAGGDVWITGQFAYAPYVDCGRCALKISWPLQVNFSSRFRLTSTEVHQPGERQLKAEEMDLSFFEGPFLDLEQAINEQVQLAIPTKTTKISTVTGSCEICLEDVSTDLVYQDQESASSHPFAALGNLSWDDEDKH